MTLIDVLARPLRVTVHAPHVRDAISVRWAMSVFSLSLLPPTLVGIYNTGYQANLAMQRLDVSAARPAGAGS